MGAMSDQSLDIDTRSFYLGNDVEDTPVMYLSLPADAEPAYAEFLIEAALQCGLRPFDHGGDVFRARGWGVLFDRQGPGDPAPLMSVHWPISPVPLVYGVRKTSPVGWADDAVKAGHVVLVIGPGLDWPAMVAVPSEDPNELGIVTWEAVAGAIGDRPAAIGIVPTSARQP